MLKYPVICLRKSSLYMMSYLDYSYAYILIFNTNPTYYLKLKKITLYNFTVEQYKKVFLRAKA